MPSKPAPKETLSDVLTRLEVELSALNELTQQGASQRARRSAETGLAALISRAEDIRRQLDPTSYPELVLDPTKPSVVARLIALVLLAQPRTPLTRTTPSYGSGIYALYYNGPFPYYSRIRGSETPIYVGKADPQDPNAESPRDQGDRLSRRIQDHVRTLRAAEKAGTLSLADFEQRSLVIQTGWQSAAEEYLIGLFRPLWNRETGICYGFGKHGDAPKTRANQFSPWDTLHPGRAWAHRDPDMQDARPKQRILKDIKDHLDTTVIYQDLDHVVRVFMRSLRQLQD